MSDSVATFSPSSSTTNVAEWKHTAAVPSESAMPTEPTSSSGLRPILSITAMATKVPTMLTSALTTLMSRDRSSPNPTACHSVDE